MVTKKPMARVLATLLTVLPLPVMAADWEWTLTPYLWGPDTSLDVAVNDDEVLGGDLSFTDLLDKLDVALQVHFEGRRDRLGFLLDATYLDTSDSTTTPPRNLLPDGARVSTDAKSVLLEAGGFYRLTGDAGTGLDLLLGVRVIDLDLDVDITVPPPLDVSTSGSTSETLTDAFIGLRYLGSLGEHWLFTVRGDVGTGDTEQALNASGYVGYRFGESGRFTVLAGYRHLKLELEDDSDVAEVSTELTMTGPALGLAFQF